MKQDPHLRRLGGVGGRGGRGRGEGANERRHLHRHQSGAQQHEHTAEEQPRSGPFRHGARQSGAYTRSLLSST